jgi:hypothetical protein
MYLKGHDIPKDNNEALKWFRKGADQGNAEAQYSLGYMYASGQGVPQDYVLAHMWFNLASPRFPASVKMRDLSYATHRTPVGFITRSFV